jgi:uncharacterized protein (DUF1800 family)
LQEVPVKLHALFAAICATALATSAGAADKFETKLSSDLAIRQAINRLTFGARPGDFEHVRAIGLQKWIEAQLHPETIPENPVINEKLKPLESVRMSSAEILKKYFPQFPPGFVRPALFTELLPPEQMRKVLNGTAEERRAAIMGLDEEKRMKVLATVPENVVEGLPDIKKEREEARMKQQESQQMEMRKLRPPLNELLTDPKQRAIALSGKPEERAALFASLPQDKLEKLAGVLPPAALADRPDLRRAATISRTPRQVVLEDLREARLYRAIYSNSQLEEVLTDFWFNHFNVDQAKGQALAMLPSYERDAIRPHVLGKFRDLLLATARHPAMLTYLDNWESMGPDVFDVGPFAPPRFSNGPPAFFRQAHGLNENYGRELMELHTLGVEGGYTQKDVIEVARCFTGWTVRSPNEKPEFVFASFMHDNGRKTVLGHTIPAGGGERDGLAVIDILARHPSTARFISTKLARRFVSDDPPPALIERMVRTFAKTDGDLRAVLETMFTSKEFSSEGAWQSGVKSPLHMVVSAVRALDANVTDTYTLADRIGQMGEPLYAKEPPSGYKDTAETWLSTANVMARIDFANALANNHIPGVKIDTAKLAGKDDKAIARNLLNRDPSPETIDAIEAQPGRTSTTLATLAISSPEFQRR